MYARANGPAVYPIPAAIEAAPIATTAHPATLQRQRPAAVAIAKETIIPVRTSPARSHPSGRTRGGPVRRVGALPEVVEIVREVGADLDRDRADQGRERGQRARRPVAPCQGGAHE